MDHGVVVVCRRTFHSVDFADDPLIHDSRLLPGRVDLLPDFFDLEIQVVPALLDVHVLHLGVQRRDIGFLGGGHTGSDPSMKRSG